MNRLKHKAQITRSLSIGDWLTLAEAWWGLLAFYVAIRSVSFDRLNRAAPVKPAERGRDIFETAQHLQRLVHLASRLHLLSMTCLPRTLTLRWMLQRRHIPAQAQIGVTKTAQGFQAHAWLEVNGQQVGEAEDVTERFQKFNFEE